MSEQAAASATDRQTVCECDALGPIDALHEVVVEREDPQASVGPKLCPSSTRLPLHVHVLSAP